MKPKVKKPRACTKEYWTTERRAEHSERMEEWFEENEKPTPYFDKTSNRYVAGEWTPEMRKTQAQVTKNVWRKRSKEQRAIISAKLKLYHLENRIMDIEALSGKVPHQWSVERRKLTQEIRQGGKS